MCCKYNNTKCVGEISVVGLARTPRVGTLLFIINLPLNVTQLLCVADGARAAQRPSNSIAS